MPITLAVLLDLPDVRVLAHRMLEDGTVLIEVESTVRTTQCRCCGREIDRFHGFDRPIRLRHLPVFGRVVFVEIRPKRYRCPDCEDGPTTTQRCVWYDPNRPHTTAFEQDVLKRLIHGTVADVSRQLALGVKAVEGLMDHPLAPVVDWTAFAALETLGIDEVALLIRGGGLGAGCRGAQPRAGGVAGPVAANGSGLSRDPPGAIESHGEAGVH
jgi:transposase